MSKSNVIILSDSEDEIIDLTVASPKNNSDSESSYPFHNPPHITREYYYNSDGELVPYISSPIAPSEWMMNLPFEDDIESEPFEDESSDEEPSEYEPTEEESEAPLHTTPTNAPSKDSTPTSTGDSYLPPSSPTAPHMLDNSNWKWVWNTLEEWRLKQTGSFANNATTPFQTYPVNGKPPSHTLPLMIAHMSHQENEIDLLKDNMETLPGTELFEEIQGGMETLEDDIKSIRGNTEQLRVWANEDANKFGVIEDRLDRIEHSLKKVNRRISKLSRKRKYIPK